MELRDGTKFEGIATLITDPRDPISTGQKLKHQDQQHRRKLI